MVPRKYRLPLRALPQFFKYSSLIKRSHFIVRATASSLSGKIAVVVGKKVSKKAVVRNKLKRQIVQHLFVEMLTTNKLKHDVVIIIFPSAMSIEKKSLLQEIITCLSNDLH